MNLTADILEFSLALQLERAEKNLEMHVKSNLKLNPKKLRI